MLSDTYQWSPSDGTADDRGPFATVPLYTLVGIEQISFIRRARQAPPIYHRTIFRHFGEAEYGSVGLVEVKDQDWTTVHDK